MPDFRRGQAALAEPEKSGNKQFTPFAPNVMWREDKEEKYLLFLNPAEDLVKVDYHDFIVVGHRDNGKPIYESFISRKDPAIGEGYDDIEDRLGQPPRERILGVAVELEPTFSQVKGRKRPTGFEVKTDTFERKTDNGTEEVTVPLVGLVTQSRFNFYGWVGSFNDSTAPIEETPVQVIRRGKDQTTTYDFTPFLDQPVDLSNLIEYVENVSYLREALDEIELPDDQHEAALAIGSVFLDTRLTELADGNRYERLVSGIDSLETKFPRGDKKPAERPQRQSMRPEPSETPKTSGKFERLRQEVESRGR